MNELIDFFHSNCFCFCRLCLTNNFHEKELNFVAIWKKQPTISIDQSIRNKFLSVNLILIEISHLVKF